MLKTYIKLKFDIISDAITGVINQIENLSTEEKEQLVTHLLILLTYSEKIKIIEFFGIVLHNMAGDGNI